MSRLEKRIDKLECAKPSEREYPRTASSEELEEWLATLDLDAPDPYGRIASASKEVCKRCLGEIDTEVSDAIASGEMTNIFLTKIGAKDERKLIAIRMRELTESE